MFMYVSKKTAKAVIIWIEKNYLKYYKKKEYLLTGIPYMGTLNQTESSYI